MGFFKKRNDRTISKNTAKAIHGRHVDYAVLRDPTDYSETVVGRDGYISIINGEVIVHCEGNDLYKEKLENARVWELMSLNGAAFDMDDGKTLVAYYSYYRK
ncbi:MAG: hypothetical protein IJD95_04745 [Clostridia bacterium]|nr:hypothetical protein [Clostridia bacterium]MBR2327868.1 hypothetical protein [Clostridia bacterium]